MFGVLVRQPGCFECGEEDLIIAIDIGAMMPMEIFKQRVDIMIRGIKDSPKAKGSERIYLPGEMEWEKRREAMANGIPLPEDVRAALRGVAADFGLTPDWLSK